MVILGRGQHWKLCSAAGYWHSHLSLTCYLCKSQRACGHCHLGSPDFAPNRSILHARVWQTGRQARKKAAVHIGSTIIFDRVLPSRKFPYNLRIANLQNIAGPGGSFILSNGRALIVDSFGPEKRGFALVLMLRRFTSRKRWALLSLDRLSR